MFQKTCEKIIPKKYNYHDYKLLYESGIIISTDFQQFLH